MNRLYSLTVSLLIVHEIDSAYWREWELFGLPGGVELFLALHLPLALLVLWGQEQVAAGTRAGFWVSVAAGASAIATAAIHAAFLIGGGAAFRSAASITLIAATAVSGLALLVSTATSPRVAGTASA